MKVRAVAPMVVAAWAATACSGDDTASTTTVGSTSAVATTAVTTTTAVATTVAPAGDASTSTSTSTPTVAPTGPACGGVGDVADQLVPAAVATTADLSTLAEGLGTTGLDGVLGADGPFTVFAPVDSAFGAVADLDALLAQPDQLTALLALHVVDEQRLSGRDLATIGTVPSLGGELSFTQDGDALVVNGAATVVCADIQTANATVHLIDTVLTPPVDEEVVGGSQLFSVDLATGTATSLGAIGEELGVLGLAFPVPDTETTAYALTDAAELVTFDVEDPETILTTTPITGVAPGSTLVALEVAEEIYAVSDASVLYVIDPVTGAAAQVGAGINPPLTDPGVGFAILPRPDRAHLSTASGENLALDVESGSAAVDPATEQPIVNTPFSVSGTARIVALASWLEPTDATPLYGIDAASGGLVLIEAPETGTLRTIGSLGISVTDGASFDIGPDGTALLVVPG